MDWSLASGRWTAAPRKVRDEVGAGLQVGTFVLERPLGRHHLADRWLARCESGAPALAYRVDRRAGGRSARAFVLAVGVLASLEHPHVSRILAIEPDVADERWIVTEYPGASRGLVTLGRLLKEREEGVLRPTEVRWLAEHLLSASAYARGRGVGHGPIEPSDVVIDRSGRACIELYGLSRRLRGEPVGGTEVAREEIRSIAAIAHRAATGRDPGRPPFRGSAEGPVGAWIAETLGGADMSAWDALARIASGDRGVERRSGFIARALGRLRPSDRSKRG